MRKGCTDKRATEEMLRRAETEASQIRSGVIDPRDLAYRDHEARPIREHLADYLRSLLAKGNSPGYVQDAGARARRVLEEGGFRRISELSLSKVQDTIQAIREREGLNQGTTNNYIRSIKGFARWLRKDRRSREHHLEFLAISNPEVDRRRIRRALSPEEAARVIQAAENGPKVQRMIGPDRAALYLTAIGSGLRAFKELRPLTPESFDLDGNPPTITAKAAYTKNKKKAVQPIPPWLVERLRPWLATKAPGKRVFHAMTRHTAEMLRADLKAAGVPYETSEGVVDFHALRTAYITYLVASGASVKTCQTLARHSSPTLTIGIYAKASLHDISGAVEDLPDLTAAPPDSEPSGLVATGTDGPAGDTHKQTLAPSCIHSGDVSVRILHPSVRDEQSAFAGGDAAKPLENKAPDGSVRLSASQGAKNSVPLLEGPVCSKNTEGVPPARHQARVGW
jgi:integrase